MKVVEKFISINGEGTKAGELAVFIRFKGCNLHCSYCDTMWANVQDCPYEEESVEDIVTYVKDTGIHNVTLTGGEPLLQKDIDVLIQSLSALEHVDVEIETNGSIDLYPFCFGHRPCFTMDYKLPSSNCESEMCLHNFSYLKEQDTVKFVVGSMEDLEKAKKIIVQYHLTDTCHVYLSPVFGSIEPVKIVQFMESNKLNNVRLQIQLHKVIWDPNERGV